MERHIRYVIDGYTTQSAVYIKNALKPYLTNLDDEVKVGKSGHRVSISFRTPEDAKLMTCEEIDEILSKVGVMAVRVIASKVVTYELEGALTSAAAGGAASGASTKKLEVSLLIALFSGIAGYVVGNIVEKGEDIIYSCEKRNGAWVRI